MCARTAFYPEKDALSRCMCPYSLPHSSPSIHSLAESHLNTHTLPSPTPFTSSHSPFTTYLPSTYFIQSNNDDAHQETPDKLRDQHIRQRPHLSGWQANPAEAFHQGRKGEVSRPSPPPKTMHVHTQTKSIPSLSTSFSVKAPSSRFSSFDSLHTTPH